MKLTTILGSIFVSMLAFASTAHANRIAGNGTDFQALTNAQQACLQRNTDGWMWYNYSSGTCGSMTVVSPTIVMNGGTGSLGCYVDGSCPSGQTVTCNLKEIAWGNGSQVSGSSVSTQTSTAGSTFDLSLSMDRTYIGDYNYSTIWCTMGAGCRIWGYSCSTP